MIDGLFGGEALGREEEERSKRSGGPLSKEDRAAQDQAELEKIFRGKDSSALRGPTSKEAAESFRAHMQAGSHPTMQNIANLAQKHFRRLEPTKQFRDLNDEEISAIKAMPSLSEEGRAAALARKVSIAPKGIAAGVDALATGGGLGEAGAALLGGAALDVAGPVGLAIGAAKFGISQAESQRAQNAVYQSVEGGSNAHAFIERGRSKLFGLSQLGVMGMGQAEQLFQGVTDIGLQGGNRQRALDFATTQYNF